MSDDLTVNTSELLTIDEARELLGYSRMHMWRLTKNGTLHPVTIGDRPYYLKPEIDSILKNRNGGK